MIILFRGESRIHDAGVRERFFFLPGRDSRLEFLKSSQRDAGDDPGGDNEVERRTGVRHFLCLLWKFREGLLQGAAWHTVIGIYKLPTHTHTQAAMAIIWLHHSHCPNCVTIISVHFYLFAGVVIFFWPRTDHVFAVSSPLVGVFAT